MNQPSSLRRSRGHRARAALNKAVVERMFVNRVVLHCRIGYGKFAARPNFIPPKGARIVEQGVSHIDMAHVLVLDAPTRFDWVEFPGDYWRVVSIERRRAA
ncbi:MAG: hypothetical protein V4614_15000 [Pseudomonadota bacterium]